MVFPLLWRWWGWIWSARCDVFAALFCCTTPARFRRSARHGRCHSHRECGRNPNKVMGLEELGMVGTRRKWGHSPTGPTWPEPVLRPTLTALAVAGPDRY